MSKMEDLGGKIYSIDSDVPIPSDKYSRYMSAEHAQAYATVKLLEVGQSFLMPKQRTAIVGNMSRASGFTLRQKIEGEMMRVWRIK